MDNDQVARRFPGEAETLIDQDEWDAGDQWLQELPELTDKERILDRDNPARTCVFSPYRGNRAYLRSQLRRRIRVSANRVEAKEAATAASTA